VTLRVAMALCGGLVACGEPSGVPRDRDEITTTRTRDAGAPDADTARFIGVITAAQSVDIAPRTAGVLATVLVRPGDPVVTGQVVAEMDPVPMREELRAAQAAHVAAAAAHRQADVDVEDAARKADLERRSVANGVSPAMNIRETELGVERARAAAQRAAATEAAEAARAQTAKDHLDEATLRAPFPGTVAMRYRDGGSTIPASTAIVRIVGRGELRLRFAVPPERARALAPGVRVTAAIDTIAIPVPAVIVQVSPALDPASGLVLIEAELAPAATATSAAELRPGLAATVSP
jgi:RND family efflux transporter MFP subunit